MLDKRPSETKSHDDSDSEDPVYLARLEKAKQNSLRDFAAHKAILMDSSSHFVKRLTMQGTLCFQSKLITKQNQKPWSSQLKILRIPILQKSFKLQ